MIPGVITNFDESKLRYTFRGYFGYRFVSFLRKKILPVKKMEQLFIKIAATEITIDAFFLLELREIAKEIINDTYGYNLAVNKRAINSLIKEIDNNTWLSKEHNNEFKLNYQKINKKFKTLPLDFQKIAYSEYEYKKNALGQKGMLTDSATGTGKTFLGLTLSEGCDVDVNIFIVMKKNIDTVWYKTMVEDPDDFFAIKNTSEDIFTSNDFSVKEYTNEKYILIHYEALDKFKAMLPLLKGKTVSIVVDEVHNFTSLESNRKKLLIDICNSTKSENIILLSGTPIKGSTLEIIPYLEILDPKFTPKVMDKYRALYGSPNFILKKCMQTRYKDISVKITKEELKLEPIEYRTLNITMPNGNDYTLDNVRIKMKEFSEVRHKEIDEKLPEYKNIYKLLIDKVKATTKVSDLEWKRYADDFIAVGYYAKQKLLRQYPDVVKRVNTFEKFNILPYLDGQDKKDFKEASVILKYPNLKIAGEMLGNVFMRLRMECHRDMAKAIDYTFIDSSLSKTIIMSAYTDIVEVVNEKVKKDGYTPVSVYGKETKNISSLIESFISNPDINPLTGTYPSISTGHHLVVANMVLLIDLPFRPYLLDQAIARVNRMGQTKQVIVIYTKLNTGEDYNINSRNIDILKWAKNTVEEITGSEITDMDFENGDTIDIVDTLEKSISHINSEKFNSETLPETSYSKHIETDESLNKVEYLIYATNKEFILDFDWHKELFSTMLKDKEYKYITIKNGIKYVKMNDKLIRTDAKSNLPIFTMFDTIKLPDNLLKCLDKPTYTSVGIFIANTLFLEYPFKGKIKYINRLFTHNELCKTLPKLMIKEIITVDEYLDYVDSVSFSLALNKFFVYSATKKMVTSAPGMSKFKEELKAKYDLEYGVTWVKDASLAIKFIEELKKFDNEYIKDDPAYGVMLSGAIVNNSRPRKFSAFGVEYGFDSTGTDSTFIINSLMDGYPKEKDQLAAMFNAARKGSFDRGSGTQQAGYMVKEIQKAINALVIKEGDCGDTIGDHILVNYKNVSFYSNIYIIENDLPVFKENLNGYLGKYVKVRTTQYCKYDGCFCEVCAGKDMENFKDGIQLLVIATLGIMLNSKMKSMHRASKKTMNFNILETII